MTAGKSVSPEEQQELDAQWQARRVPLDTELRECLLETFGSMETAYQWLDAPNPVLAGHCPADYLRRGNVAAIQRLLRMAETGMPA